MTATAWPPRQHDDGPTAAPWMQAEPFPCRTSPELFFSDDPTEVGQAKRLCKSACTRVASCLQYSLEQRIPFGVWGGLSKDERGFAVADVFRCASCGEDKPAELRRGEWCAACTKRWRLAGKPAGGPPAPMSRADAATKARAASAVSQAATFQKRLTQYAALIAQGMNNAEASFAVGVSKWRGQEYARLLEAGPATPSDVHPWRQGAAVLPQMEASA